MWTLMMKVILGSGLAAARVGVQSDCKNAELKALRLAAVKAIEGDNSLEDLDCTVLREEKREKLLVLVILSTPDGQQTFAEVFDRPDLRKTSVPLFKSEALGVDALELVAGSRHRLIFALPEGGKVTRFYLVNQSSTGDVKLSGRDLDLAEKSLSEVADHQWPVDATYHPKLLRESKKWRAILKGKIVDL